MYLSKLEIFGFKSFANKTVINFTKGLTGIVGPNGCGKTNIVDAIRWCLGEQKSSTLRSDKMENVIFNGTRNKKPMGMSEVSLSLINDNGQLPTEYSEITITRRIFRSGESEYLLNKNICRLKDITNLFMDTGMGTNAYSVIELKMVETILSSRAEERRKMFEEAAGVNKYKLRRRLSLKKLDEVKLNLTRVNDIVAEVEKSVRSLERQAKRASKYNQFQTILRDKELDLSNREFTLYSNQINVFNSQQSELLERKEKSDSEIREIENKLITYRSETNDIESALRNKQFEISEQTNKQHEVQKHISVSEERLRTLDIRLKRFENELEDLSHQSESNEQTLAESNFNIVNIKSEINDKSFEIEQLENTVNEKKVKLDFTKNQLKLSSEEAIEKYTDLSNKQNRLSNIKNALNENNNRLQKLNDKILSTTTTIAKTVGYLEDLSNERAENERRLKNSEELFVAKTSEKNKLESKLNELKEIELTERTGINALKEKINFFQSLITNLEGISKASKILLESDGWSKNEKILFADVGDTKEKFRLALESSLKLVLNNLLIADQKDLEKAVELLQNNKLGQASFFILGDSDKRRKTILDRINNYNFRKKAKKLQAESAFINWAFDLVETDEKWKPYFNKVLQKTAVTKDLQSALRLNVNYPDFDFTTLNGDIVKSNGVVEGGSAPNLDETLFGRKQLLEKLKLEYPTLENNLELLRGQILEAEKNIKEIDLNVLSEEGKILLNEINNIEKQISQLEFEKNKSEEEIESSQAEIDELTGSTASKEAEINEIQNEIQNEIESKNNFDLKINSLELEVKDLEDNFNFIISDLNNKKVDMERINGRLQYVENEITRCEETKTTVSQSIEKHNQDIENANSEIITLKSIIEDYNNSLLDISEQKDKLVKDAEGIENDLNNLKSESAIFEKELNNKRTERENYSEDIHKIQLSINEIKYKLESLKSNIKEEYSIDLYYIEFDDLESFNFDEIRIEVHELKAKIKNLGPINLLAYSEYEEEKERFEFLNKQRTDLIESERDLVKTIKEINITAQKKFSETFLKIKQNFQNIFRTLFDPGDEADLTIEEDADPLDAKIEIIAKPKGKRPTSIELLSGGEKTLTATALLFAIYLVKPSPFCILDEVDAPLDDANIDRFTKLLSEFKNNTQFIVVTHNKRTMEAVENMYGVTMQEEGVSKLAGVQFNEEIQLN